MKCSRLAETAVTILLLTLAAAAQAPRPAREFRAEIRSWRAENERQVLALLAEFLAIPNLADDRDNIRRNADYLVSQLQQRGVQARLLEGEGPPAVYGELKTPGVRRTVIFYAHYDGQPVDAAGWASDPWKPLLRDKPLEAGGQEIGWREELEGPVPGEWRLYARSASDDKAPIIAMLAALDALKARGIPLSVNLKFFFEGEEEAGSPHLRQTLERNHDLLRGDVWLLCDGPVHQSRRMQVFFGARGIQGLTLTVYGATRTLHSGHYGNWAPNPAMMLAHLLASMRNSEGRVLMNGFYDAVRPLSEAEEQALAALPDIDAELRQELGLARSEGEMRLARSITQPALNLRGLESGRVGAQAANAIPTQATASIDFRLVPDLTPEKVKQVVEAHLRKQGYFLVSSEPSAEQRRRHARIARLEWDAGYPASRTAMDRPVAQAVVQVVQKITGRPVVKLPTLGGSVPMYLFQRTAPVVGVPIVNHDNNQHGANENLRLQNLWDGIEIYAALMARLGGAWEETPANRTQP